MANAIRSTLQEYGYRNIRVLSFFEILNVTNPRVTVILNDMEGRGLVQRSPLASDRRTVIVSLTAEGKEAVENRIRQRRERLERFVDKIGPQDGEALIRILDAYRELEADERR